MTNQIREASEIYNSISNVLNSSSHEKTNLKPLLQELYNSYGVILSTYFLRNLCEGTPQQKSKKVLYALSLMGSEIEAQTKTFKFDEVIKHDVETTIFKHDKNGNVFISEVKTFRVGLSKRRYYNKVFNFIKPY